MSFARSRVKLVSCIFLILTIIIGFLAVRISTVKAQPAWPISWIEIDRDRNEDGATDDWRDVETAYFSYDNDYLYLKLHCYATPGSEWPTHEARYKWFIDLDGVMIYSGGNIYDAEYLIFVEDTDANGVGDLFLVSDIDSDNNFGEYEPWPPINYQDYAITDPSIGGWRIVAPYQIEMYVNWTAIETPTSYQLFWATDQQNPNLDQGPTTDRVDEEQPILIHNVAATSQIPNPSIVHQGENVSIQVIVENQGTQIETFNVTCYFNTTEIATQLVTNLAAGHQKILTYEWNTSSLPEGNYSIKVWADSSCVITETDEEDNWCTSPATVTILPPLHHDVAATSQVPDKSSAIKGQTVNINVTVSNLGDFSEDFNVTCFYGNTPIDTQIVTSLAPDSSTSLDFLWNTSGVTPNTYYIRAMADSSKKIFEINEVNNNCSSFETVTVYSLGEMGKLFVDKTKTALMSGEDPPVVGYSTVYEFTIIVTNIGGSDVSNIQVNETISTDVSFINVTSLSQGSNFISSPPPRIIWNVGTLAPGANATLTFKVSITPTSAVMYYLNHKEDLQATGIDTLTSTPVSDTGDTDTTVAAIIRDVAASDQTPTSTIVSQGDTLAVDVTVKNLGNVSATFDTACYYDGNLIDTIRIYNLEANSETIISFAWDTTSVPPGTYSITAEADSSHEIPEGNETNNLCTSLATVEIVIHDIAIISQLPSPTTVTEGEIVMVDVVITNEGTEPETFTVSCYYNETFLETKTVTDLAPSTNITVTFLWNTNGATPGLYYINTAASAVLGEKDTDDNACQSTTTVTVEPCTHTLTVSSSSGGNTSLSGSHEYPCSSSIDVSATPDACFLFDHWELDGSHVGNNNPITVHMDADHTLHAVFTAQDPFELTIQIEGTGNTNPEPGIYDSSCGENVIVVAIETDPDRWPFSHWVLDGSPAGSTKSIVVHMEDHHLLRAVFVYQPPYIGGTSISVESSPVDVWMLLNTIFITCFFITAAWTKKRRCND